MALIRADDGLLAECQVLAEPLRQEALRGAGPEGVKLVIGRRFLLYPQPLRSEAEWALWWDDYVETLADMPAEALERAMRLWIARPEAEFLPRPGELLALAREQPTQAARRAHRARLALEPPPWDAPAPYVPMRRIVQPVVKTTPDLPAKTFPASVWRELADKPQEAS